MSRKLLGLFAVCVFQVASLLAQHPTGVRQLTPEERMAAMRDVVEYEPPAKKRGGPPSRVVNQAHLPKVWSQGSLGICGSFAPTYYVRNYYESMRRGEGRWDFDKEEDRAKMVSPTWSVIMVDHSAETAPDGANPLITLRTLCNLGYLTLAELPFEGSFQDWYAPSYEEQLTALSRKGGKTVCLSNITTEEGLEKLKKALAAGDIFVIITDRIPPNFDHYPLNGENLEVTLEDNTKITVNSNNHNVFVWPSKIEPNSTREAHALTIIGYDDDMVYTGKDGKEKKGALLAVNSWGQNWGVEVNGEGGYIWFAYESFMTHHFISGEVYSATVGDGNYTPTMTAKMTFSCEGYTNGWKQFMVGSYGRNWPGGFDFKVNGIELDNPFFGLNLYVKGQQADPSRAEMLLDMSGFENMRLWQFDAYLGFASNMSDVGKVVQADFYDASRNLTRSVPLDIVAKPFSTSYPTFEFALPTLYDTMPEGGLPPLYPHGGSIQFGDLNGDGLVDAVSSVRQDNGIEEGVVNDEGITMCVESRHAVWLRQADGTWQESLLPISGLHAEVILVDLTGNGVLDLAASNGTNTYFFQNDGNGNFTQLAVIAHKNGEYEAQGSPGYFATADFDNDGKPDFILVNSGQTQVIRQETSTKYTVYPVSNKVFREILPITYDHCLAVGDVNGDGWTDFVAICEEPISWNEHCILYINNGNLRFTPYELPLPAARFTSIAIADADQDGCDDILYCGGPHYDWNLGGSTSLLRILHGRPNDASGNVQLPTPIPIAAGIESRWGGNATWADVDMDGRLEVIMSGMQGTTPSNGNDPYGYNSLGVYPLHKVGNCYLKILAFDGEMYVDSQIELPGTGALTGPTLMTVTDLDKDGKPDIVHGGLFYACSETIAGRQGPDRSVTGMKYVHNEVHASNAAPFAPTGLSAKDAGNGKATFSWEDGADAETHSGGLRYFMRVGTASGKDDVISSSNKFPRKSGVTLTNLPAKKLYWAVRTVDATGNVSPWSAEGTVTPSGSTPKPSVPTLESLPDVTPVPDMDYDNVDCTSADETQGTAYAGYTGYSKVGELIELYATPKAGYRFAYWEGPALEPLSRSSKAYYYGEEKFVAHFMLDTSYLQASEKATGYRDDCGNLWLWGKYKNVNGTVKQDTPPAFAAAANTLYFALANDTAYYGISGPYNASDYYSTLDRHHWANPWGANCLLRAVDGSDWNGRDSTTDKEQIERAWGGPGGLAVLLPATKNNRRLSVIGGAETGNDTINLTEGEDIVQCAVQEGFVLILNTVGKVKGIGNNELCQLGASAPQAITQYVEIKGLPLITSIAAGAGFGAALDIEGNVWTWGDNSKGQLGRGTAGATYPVPAKVENLYSKVIAIAAGDKHLLALDEYGALHAWGDNYKGQLGDEYGFPLSDKRIKAVAAAGERSVALDEQGNLYAWGDGEAQPQLLDNLSFTPISFTLSIDDRYAHLLPMASGNYAARTGQPITLTAKSDTESAFQYWTVNGVLSTDNPLTVTPTDPFVVKAFFASHPSVITLGEPEILENLVKVAVIMSGSSMAYDGIDFSVQFSKSLVFSEIESPWPTPYYKPQFEIACENEGMKVLRFLVYGSNYDEKLFNRDNLDNVQLFKLVFIKPTTSTTASVTLPSAPRLSRDWGQYSEASVLGNPASRVFDLQGEKIEPGSPESYKNLSLSYLQPQVWNPFYLPGESDIHTVAELQAALGVQNLVVQKWDGSKYEEVEEITPFQPLLMKFTGNALQSLPYIAGETPGLELSLGWNLVVLPTAAQPPDKTRFIFTLDKNNKVYVRHYGTLQPNELYWIFKDSK